MTLRSHIAHFLRIIFSPRLNLFNLVCWMLVIVGVGIGAGRRSVLIGLALPRHASVQLDARIDAHPATVYALVNDFRRVKLWSPQFDADPNARVVHSGPARGVDSTMTWDGTIIGSGTQVITDANGNMLESRLLGTVVLEINAESGLVTGTWQLRFKITGGTGRYVNAKGHMKGVAINPPFNPVTSLTWKFDWYLDGKIDLGHD